jgi:hypothetical protein
MLVCTTNDDEMMKKLGIKFHQNENIEWHYMQFELILDLIYFNPNSIEFKNIKWIQIQFNWIHILFNSNFQLKINKIQIGPRRY